MYRETGGQKRLLSSMAAKRAGGFLCQIGQKRLTLPALSDPGIGPVAGSGRAALMRLRRSETEPIFQLPIRRWIGPGAAIWKALLGFLGMAGLRSSSGSHERCPVFHQLLDPDFERLSHVAVDLQSLFVRAGDICRFCSPNEQ
jgi:hypothetical protein